MKCLPLVGFVACTFWVDGALFVGWMWRPYCCGCCCVAGWRPRVDPHGYAVGWAAADVVLRRSRGVR